jgi:hypothetical protein
MIASYQMNSYSSGQKLLFRLINCIIEAVDESAGTSSIYMYMYIALYWIDGRLATQN